MGGTRAAGGLARDADRRAASLAPTTLVFEGDWSPASGEEGLTAARAERPDIDAVFASNDQMALGVLHAAHRLGRRIPDELSVVGVDDIAEGSHFWPPLTTVHQPLRDAGRDRRRRSSRGASAWRAKAEPRTP